ncbi:large subunit ribosomal protein L7e [Nematocida sp. AWRm80]|nr:large subunit ribosomal protein L7e [Nematocida sp. AWRm80]
MEETQVLSKEQIKEITIGSIKRMKNIIKEEEEKKIEAEKNNQIYVPEETKVLFVVRIRSANKASPAIVRLLKNFRLHNINTGTFVINNYSTMQMLRKVRTYVAYGTLSLETMRELIYTRGFCKINGCRQNITQDTLYARFGGEIAAVEQIVEALFVGAPNAGEINKWLWPFRLSAPNGGFGGRKIRDFAEGGSTGDHGRYLENLVKRMM